VQQPDRILTQYPSNVLGLESGVSEAVVESILNVVRTIWGILADIFWYGITQWFGRQFAKVITEGPTLEEWQRDLDEKLKQESAVDPLEARPSAHPLRPQIGSD
jgi:hypothetical protein